VSLTVPASLLEKAQRGAVWDEEFVDCIRESLPYAWSTVERLAKELDASGAPSVQNLEVPPDDAAWGEAFRLVGSDAMRGTVQENLMRLPPGRSADLIQRNREAGTAQICHHTLASGEHPEVGEAGKTGRQDWFERVRMFPR
jgi:hypothetical protein